MEYNWEVTFSVNGTQTKEIVSARMEQYAKQIIQSRYAGQKLHITFIKKV